MRILLISLLLVGCASLPTDLTTLDDQALCVAMYQGEPVEAEVIRRGILSDDEYALAAAQKVQVGMSELAMLCSWGRPDRINRASYGDQWVYCRDGYYCIRNQYVYFRNGIVTSWN